MHQTPNLSHLLKRYHGTVKGYMIGLVASLLLTTLSFSLVIFLPFSTDASRYLLGLLALSQATLQLIFFLHLGAEKKLRWEGLIFLLMFIVLLIIVAGSLWVMEDLNSRVMVGM